MKLMHKGSDFALSNETIKLVFADS